MEHSAHKVDRKIKIVTPRGERGNGIVKIQVTQKSLRNAVKTVRILADYRTKQKHN